MSNPLDPSYRRLVALKMVRGYEKAIRFGDNPPDDPMDARIERWIEEARLLPERNPRAKKKATA